MFGTIPPYWAIALALLAVSLVVAAVACWRANENVTAAIAGVPGVALLAAFGINAWHVIA